MLQIEFATVVELQNKASLPESSGVYLVVSEDGEVIYVGQSVNLKHRFVGHHLLSQFEATSKICWIFVEEEHLLIEEKILIDLFNPRLNGVPGRPAKPGKRLSGKISNRHNDLLDELCARHGWTRVEGIEAAIQTLFDDDAKTD